MWHHLIQTHGYWALALGCPFEGETVLSLAGFAAHCGWLDPLAVFGIASAAGFAGDQFFFWVGRRHGTAVLRHCAAGRPWAARAHGSNLACNAGRRQ